MDINTLHTPTPQQAQVIIDPNQSTFLDEALTSPQRAALVWCVDNNQAPVIRHLTLRSTTGQHLSYLPETYVPQWWHDAHPANVWEDFLPGVFRLNMVPHWMGRMIDDEAYSMGTPTEALLAGCMAAVAGALSDQIQVQTYLKRDWFETGRLWQAVIANSGAKKSPALRTGLAPLQEMDSEFAAGDAQRRAHFEIAMKRHERRVKAQEKSDDPIDLPPPPKHPKTHRFLVNDTTVEALSMVLQNQPRGTTLYMDEIARWLAALDGNSKASADRALYLELYDGGSRKIDRVGRGLGIYVPNWSGSIIGGIQPSTLQKAMKDVPVDGLLQRFLPYVCLPANKPTNEPKDEATWARFHRLVKRINGMFDGVVQVSDDARRILSETWDDLYDLMRQPHLSEPLASHIAKWEGGMYRVALVLHAIECADQNVEMIMQPISAETARMVSRLYANLYLPNLFVLYEQILVPTRQSNHQRWIAGHILKEELLEISVRDIYRTYREFDKMSDWERLRVLENLEAHGWLQRKETFSKAVVPRDWFVNPKVHFFFPKRAQEELERRREIVSSIRARK
ncbi:DUF3987 domain-containing protein [Falsiruegeria mediterranea]